jgi:hypothetical protein
MGEQGRLVILERYEWSHHIQRLEELFELVMGDEKAPMP